MTTEGIKELYTRLAISWPTIYRQNGSEGYNRSMMKIYYDSFRDLTDEEVLAGLQKWTEENEKAPTIKALINEAKWLRIKNAPKAENEELHPMDFITKEGIEWSYGLFKRSDFVNHPRNPEHLQPEEWERRFNLTRKRIIDKLIAEREQA